MQAIVLREVGGPQKLHLEEIETPVAGPGEMLIKLRYAAFNRRDVFITQGLYPGIVFPVISGSDGCGVVAAHGPGANGPAVGTTVLINPMFGWGDDARVWRSDSTLLGMPRHGTFAEYVTVPAENVHLKPERLSDEQAAAIPLGGLTAYRAVFTRGGCTADDVVLLPGIGGGVQTFALSFVKSTGARAIVTSSSDAKLARAKALGADVAINYKTSENWSKEVRAQSGGGPTLVIDSVGGETFAKALDIARYGARVVTYGGTTGDAKIRPFSVFWKQLDILGTSMGSPADFAAMLHLFATTSLEPVIDEVVDLAAVPAAAQRILDGKQFGKLVVRIS
ncbi:MAG: zinc-binding dehydrogenase [Candidatus Lustribacter sp.]|jgi:NADPH:quinone reductase-like Zn-dependent oxidoreductase